MVVLLNDGVIVLGVLVTLGVIVLKKKQWPTNSLTESVVFETFKNSIFMKIIERYILPSCIFPSHIHFSLQNI